MHTQDDELGPGPQETYLLGHSRPWALRGAGVA